MGDGRRDIVTQEDYFHSLTVVKGSITAVGAEKSHHPQEKRDL